MLTFKTIIRDLQNFVSAHAQINTFFVGKVSEFQTQQNIYPAVIVIPSNAKIQLGATDIQLQILVVDRLKEDLSNYTDSYNNTLFILQDIFAYMYWKIENDGEQYWQLDPINAKPLNEFTSDYLSGWVATMNFQLIFNANECLIPYISGSTP